LLRMQVVSSSASLLVLLITLLAVQALTDQPMASRNR
jgi:hypothetical protein